MGKLVLPERGVDSKVLADVLTVFAHFEGILAAKLGKSSVSRGNWADLARKIRIFGLRIVAETRYCVWKQRLRRALEMVLLFQLLTIHLLKLFLMMISTLNNLKS